MNIRTILAASLVVLAFTGCKESTPQEMAATDLKSCYRSLPDGRDIFRFVEYHHAKKHCDTMKMMYETAYKTTFTY
jgi:hypothetical protein